MSASGFFSIVKSYEKDVFRVYATIIVYVASWIVVLLSSFETDMIEVVNANKLVTVDIAN